jgi:hypothetical protein
MSTTRLCKVPRPFLVFPDQTLLHPVAALRVSLKTSIVIPCEPMYIEHRVAGNAMPLSDFFKSGTVHAARSTPRT